MAFVTVKAIAQVLLFVDRIKAYPRGILAPRARQSELATDSSLLRSSSVRPNEIGKERRASRNPAAFRGEEMRVTLLGHASLIVEVDGVVCLMDRCSSTRSRKTRWSPAQSARRLQSGCREIDLLVVSHRHPDHFDIRSLAQVARACDVVCPPDPLNAYALKRIGFARPAEVEQQRKYRRRSLPPKTGTALRTGCKIVGLARRFMPIAVYLFLGRSKMADAGELDALLRGTT